MPPPPPTTQANQVEGLYFDGVTSRARSVVLSVADGIACLQGDLARQCPLDALRVSQRLRNGRRRITFPDGAVLEINDLARIDALLAATGFDDGWIITAQYSTRTLLIALLLTVMALGAAYRFGIPAAAKVIAFTLPVSVERSVGDDTMRILDKYLFAPSALPATRRDTIQRRFRLLTANVVNAPEYRIVFRKSRRGPNAFVLPSGDIVLTDEIVALAGNDDAIMGILGHELGHLRQRHLMRRVIQSSATAALATVLLGDVSALAVNMPTLIVDMAYSRDAEREADDEAIALLKANGIALAPFAQVFATLAKEATGKASYLSTHPASEERIARIRAER